MTAYDTQPLTEAAVDQAIACRAALGLAVTPPVPGRPGILRSRFLGTVGGHGDLAVQTPHLASGKIFLPTGTRAHLTFAVGELAVRAGTQVVGHCQFAIHATGRVDACLLERPKQVVAANQRGKPRTKLDPQDSLVMASLWAPEAPDIPSRFKPWLGRLHDRSNDGLGVLFPTRLPYRPGTEVIVRLDPSGPQLHPFYRAKLKHCSRGPNGQWLVGLGDLTELPPDEVADTTPVPPAE